MHDTWYPVILVAVFLGVAVFMIGGYLPSRDRDVSKEIELNLTTSRMSYYAFRYNETEDKNSNDLYLMAAVDLYLSARPADREALLIAWGDAEKSLFNRDAFEQILLDRVEAMANG